MTMYLMSDVTGFTVHEENGGCGQPHSIDVNEDGVRTLTCPQCESAMQQGHGYGHAAHPKGVLATPDEVAARERLDADAKVAGMTRLAELTAGTAGAVPQALLDQMAAMQATIEQLQGRLAEQDAKTVEEPAPAKATKSTAARK